MQLTNKYNLPETLIRATQIRNGAYNRGPVKRSITQLLSAPQIDLLRKRHYKDMVTDVTDEFFSLLGSAVHHLVEIGATDDQVVEERLFAEVDGWPISGAIDLQEFEDGKVHISDYKVTSAFSVGLEKIEWEQQQNCYRWLIETVKGIPVASLTIVAIVRDWSRAQSKTDRSYPVAPIVKVPMKMWTMEETEAFLKERIAAHREAEMIAGLGMSMPECTDEDRWVRDGTWAVIKKGGKRAKKVFDIEEDAVAFRGGLTDEYETVFRPGSPTRCRENYCGVSRWCPQWAREQNHHEEKE